MTNPRITAQSRIDTPLGAMTAAATEHGLAGLWFDGQAHHPGPLTAPLQPGQRWLKAANAALTRYFEGDPEPLRGLPLGSVCKARHTARWNGVPCRSSGRPRSGSGSPSK